MRNAFASLLIGTALAAAACQQSHDTTAGGADTSANVATTTATGNDTAPADEADGTPNTSRTPDTLTTAVGAVATAGEADDAGFAVKAAQGSMLEVELGKLAQVRGADAGVKEMGGMMVKDHSKAGDDLKAVAARKDMKLPAALSAEGKALYDKLSKLSGKEFDREYLNAMVDDHQKDIKEFEKEANKGKDTDLRAFAGRTLPIIREHATMFGKHQKMM